MSRPSRACIALLCIALCIGRELLFVAGAAMAQEEGPPADGPDWIPSLGVGFGIYSRGATSSVNGRTRPNPPMPVHPFLTTTSGTAADQPMTVSGLGNPRSCVPVGNPQLGLCGPYEDVDRDGYDGGAPSFSAQLLGPSWRSAWWSPRPYALGMFALPLSSRTLAKDGFKPVDFAFNGAEPDVRIEMGVNPQNFWLAGGGVAFKLPWDRYDVRAKLGLSFMQESLHVSSTGTIAVRTGNTLCGDPPNLIDKPIVESVKQKKSLTIPSVTPSFGLEADVAKFGPVMLTITADTYFSLALGGTNAGFSFETPRINTNCIGNGRGTGILDGSFKADDLHIFGNVGMRLGWVGWGR